MVDVTVIADEVGCSVVVVNCIVVDFPVVVNVVDGLVVVIVEGIIVLVLLVVYGLDEASLVVMVNKVLVYVSFCASPISEVPTVAVEVRVVAIP